VRAALISLPPLHANRVHAAGGMRGLPGTESNAASTPVNEYATIL